VVQYHPVYEAPALSCLYGAARHGCASDMAPSPDVHFPKGSHKAGRKAWTRFQAWQPPAAAALAAQ
jgi:hypothetical protein